MKKVVLVFAFAALCIQTPVAAESFYAGVAVTDITPETGLQMWGYSSRTRPSEGVLDPLYAKAIVFRVGDETLAMVTLDLGRVPLPDVCGRIRSRVASKGVDHVLFTASHTHQAPAMDVDAPYIRTMETKIAETIERALSSLVPVHIGVGRTDIDIAHNRRKILDNGQCMMVWRNVQRIETGPVDKEAGIIKIAKADGSLLAVLVNYACHPVVLGPDNLQYSADYVGEMARVVKEHTGAECLFLQGGSGDINPYHDKTPLGQDGVATMRMVGRTAGNTILAALGGILTAPPDSPSIAVVEKRVEVGTRWDMTLPHNVNVLRNVYGPIFDQYLAQLPPDLSVPLTVILLNGNLAFACVSGEPFVQFQLDLKTHSPVRDTFLVGYANEFHAYFPTVKDAIAGGYGGIVNTFVGLGAGDKLILESTIEIGRLLGKLPEKIEPAGFVLLEAEPSPQ